VLDLLPPVTLQDNTVHVPTHPLLPHLAYRVIINDADLRYSLVGIGSRWVQIVIFILLALIPVVTGIMGIIVYRWGFYGVKFNQVGVDVKNHILPPALRRKFHLRNVPVEEVSGSHGGVFSNGITNGSSVAIEMSGGSRRKILIATMEYFIEDWDIKVNIGGLGVMAQLMAKHLHDKDLIWVVPCLGGIDYPTDQTADPMHVKILDYEYTVEVQYHVLRNITFILLDAPIFRGQRKGRPYPERMDDFDSAIYYSTWNSCIAEAIKRFPQIDLYHINDYHGAIAPLHLLPRVIPCCLSLHNAEFQGLWPIRNSKEMDETCRIYNLDVETVRKYVQFGEVFNLLHGAASYLRIHQKGFGAVGVSAKYGKRSFQRYPIFWGLRKIGSLPNPDPADTGELNLEDPLDTIHQRLETEKPDQKCQAQQWASLHRDPHAELFCFVGRMSAQKGIDLIADVFPSVLKKHPTSQLIAIGPVIDLYGKFAALKLQRLMRAYPGRVCVIPQFTSVPPYVFGGVDWALIPSRDEPFGLVAVEFGRRGVLCIGAKVGGLGSMPGWWFTIESTTTKHLLDQFAKAMETALASKAEVRASMRAQATTQRFPVAQWQSKLVDLQEKAINISSEQVAKALHRQKRNRSATESPMSDMSPSPPPLPSSPLVNRLYNAASLVATGPPSPIGFEQDPATENPPLSLGTKLGPGHAPESCGDRDRRRLKSPSPHASSIEPLSEIQTSPSPLPLPTPPRSHSTHRRMSSMETIDMIPNSDQDSVYSLPYPGGTRVSHWNGYDEDTRSLVMEDYYLVPELASLRQTSGPWTRDGRPQAPSFVLNAHAMPDPFISYPESPGVPPPASGGDAQHLGFQTEPDQGFQLHDNDSTLSLDAVANGKKDYQLQNVQPIFTDPTGQYFDKFERLLDETDLTERHHEAPHIEAYLVKSEKEWYQRYHDVKMGRSDSGASRASPIFPPTPTSTTPAGSFVQDRSSDEGNDSDGDKGQFPLQENYVPPKALERFLLIKFGDWPIYSFLLAFVSGNLPILCGC
jgi:alpha-1,3-glucan synthase